MSDTVSGQRLHLRGRAEEALFLQNGGVKGAYAGGRVASMSGSRISNEGRVAKRTLIRWNRER
jgi:hypothetical protein